MQRRTYSLTAEDAEWLSEMGYATRTSASAVIRQLIADERKRHEQNEKRKRARQGGAHA